jgi:drug/metabolite transporter (DMT)-like permease
MSDQLRADPPAARKAGPRERESMGAGAAFSLLAFGSLAAMNALVKLASASTSTAVLVFFQNLICFAVVLPFVLRDGTRALATRRIGMHVFRAVTGSGAWYGLFVAIKLMPLASAVLLTYSAPLWMPLIAWLGFREAVTPRVWIGALLGFVGILLVLHPGSHVLGWGAVFAIGAAILLALALLAVRWLGATEPTARILFYYFMLSSALMLPLVLTGWRTPSPRDWAYLAGIGGMLLLSQLFIVIAYRYASAVRLSPFIYSVIVFTALLDWAVWGQTPSASEALGMAVVVAAGVFAAIAGRHESGRLEEGR